MSRYLVPWLAGAIIASAMLFQSATNPSAAIDRPAGYHSTSAKQAKQKSSCLWRKSFLTTTYGPPWDEIEGGPETAIGTPLRPGRHVVAVDRNVIPLGSKLRIWPNPHNYRGSFTAEDVGGAIIGRHIDIYVWQGRAVRDFWRQGKTKVCLLSRG